MDFGLGCHSGAEKVRFVQSREQGAIWSTDWWELPWKLRDGQSRTWWGRECPKK